MYTDPIAKITPSFVLMLKYDQSVNFLGWARFAITHSLIITYS
jgi:hypothetical protein